LLHLSAETDPEWASRAVLAIDTILLDHAHLEKKAASTAVNLIFRYPDHTALMRPLSELAREELDHFEQVLSVLEDRGIRFARIKPSPYAARLTEIVRAQEPERLLDTLITCAFIEARSCERMKILSDHLDDPKLKTFYGSLLASEAKHHRTYLDLAESIFDPSLVASRTAEISAHEASVIRGVPKEPRLHNG
jgi:tRNA-(ms[2]io[6]A)-hydroxylase